MCQLKTCDQESMFTRDAVSEPCALLDPDKIRWWRWQFCFAHSIALYQGKLTVADMAPDRKFRRGVRELRVIPA